MDLGDVDLSAPLRTDETLPELKHREVPQLVSAKKKKKGKDKDEKKGKGKDKGKGKGKGKDKGKDKDKDKGGGDLIDFGDFGEPMAGSANRSGPPLPAAGAVSLLSDEKPAKGKKKGKKANALKSATSFSPKPTTLTEFGGLMQNTALKWYQGAATLAAGGAGADMVAIAAALGSALNAHVVDTQQSSTSLYAMSDDGAHLAVLAKFSAGTISVQLKCTSKSTAKKISADLAELASLLPEEKPAKGKKDKKQKDKKDKKDKKEVAPTAPPVPPPMAMVDESKPKKTKKQKKEKKEKKKKTKKDKK
eukprot:g111.t1